MRFKDIAWIAGILIFSLILVFPETRTVFNQWTESSPYGMAFIKTAYLATMGEMLVHRLKQGTYSLGKTMWMKALVWGLLGMLFVFIFHIFASGVMHAQEAGLLPALSGTGFMPKLLTAFLTSLMMNLFFAPTFMFFHRITDGYIDRSLGSFKGIFKIKLHDVVKSIDMKRFIDFIVIKTIPFFWLPAHTITFLLPSNYRILMAAYLSIALGIILTFANKPSKTTA